MTDTRTQGTDLFSADLKRFGPKRTLARDAHRDRIREFMLRQKQLSAAGFVQFAFYIVSGSHPFFAMLGALLFMTAIDECRRMRACGRYWQCKRSIEVIGT